jgi:hypothetical protein
MSLLDQVKGDMSGVENLLAKIPGYKGYKEKGNGARRTNCCGKPSPAGCAR